MIRPDFSNYLVHFTKDKPPIGIAKHKDDQWLQEIAPARAFDRLVSILKEGFIRATPMPWTNARAVALTECPWGSLLHHAMEYSPYGVGFEKGRLFAAGGGPAIYLRTDLYDKQASHCKELGGDTAHPFHPGVWPFVTPFAPPYAPAKFKEKWAGKPVDYTHEREWRVPHDFTFKYSQVTFVLVNSYEDVAKFPKNLKDEIGRDRFLIMDVYRQIERFWPIHLTKA